MISAARLLALATACATLLIAGALAEPAGAQDDVCKAETFTAAGRAKFRPFSKAKELEGRGAAMADAVANWQREIGAKFGERWKLWSEAKDTSFDCAPTRAGKIIGSSFIGCTISGRPCAPAASRDGDAVADDDGGGEIVRAKRRRAGGGRGLDPEARAYAREMAYQDRLTAERARAEARAYEREMARQRQLAAERTRAESAAWERENARQRQLADQRRKAERDPGRGLD
jgi:hypothetical protein